MGNKKAVNVSEIFDNSRFSPYQCMVVSICFLVTFLDGFDLTVIGVALPKIADHLHSKPSTLGFALGISQIGPVIGAMVLGTLADRWGRKWMLFISAFIFGIFTIMIAFITSVEQLAIYRFIAGIGLGGAVPNALAFGSEFSPSRARATLISTMYAGVPAGSTLGGLSAAYLIPHFGWQSLFVLGGGVPILIAFTLAAFLPESLEFLVQHGKDEGRIRKIVARFAPAIAHDRNAYFISSDKKREGVPVKHLFTEGRAVTTLLLWAICTAAIYMVWILVSWAPTLLRNTGATVEQYSLAYAGLMFGAVVASICVGRMMDKLNPFIVLQVGFILACISLATFGLTAGSSFAVMVFVSILCGSFINGSQTGTLAIATTSYPPAIRTTGIGWAYAIAKIGAITAPALGGLMLDWGWSVARICGTNAFTGIVIAGLIMVLQKRIAMQTSKAEAALEMAS